MSINNLKCDFKVTFAPLWICNAGTQLQVKPDKLELS